MLSLLDFVEFISAIVECNTRANACSQSSKLSKLELSTGKHSKGESSQGSLESFF
jgi:hypothetical protein